MNRRLLNEIRKALSKRGCLCNFRVLNEDLSKPSFAPRTLSRWGSFYSAIDSIATPNSFTFDDSDRLPGILGGDPRDSGGHDMSMTFETMDNEIFTTYLSDSAY